MVAQKKMSPCLLPGHRLRRCRGKKGWVRAGGDICAWVGAGGSPALELGAVQLGWEALTVTEMFWGGGEGEG